MTKGKENKAMTRVINNLDDMMNDISNGSSGVSMYFKPEAGRTTIRIVSPDGTFPIRNYWYHYNIGEKPVYSRYRNLKDDSCPLNAYTQKLWNSQNVDEYRSVKASSRFYAPVIIRGQEELGVKIWSFSKKCFTDMVDELKANGAGDDFYDSEEGRDITLIYKKPDTGFPSTQLIAAQVATPLDKSKRTIKQWEAAVPDIDAMHPEISHEDAFALVKDKLGASGRAAYESDQDHFEANDHKADDIPF